MAFRGAIALTKGFKILKIQEEKKVQRVKKWERKYQNKNSNDDRFFNGIQRSSTANQTLHTDGGVVRFKRTKTAYDYAINGKIETSSVPRLKSLYEGCYNCVASSSHDQKCFCADSSLQSGVLSSELEVRSPSAADFEDYQNRRNAFLTRQKQRQDLDDSESSRYSIGAKSSGRKLIQAYKQRKLEAEKEKKMLRDRIRNVI